MSCNTEAGSQASTFLGSLGIAWLMPLDQVQLEHNVVLKADIIDMNVEQQMQTVTISASIAQSEVCQSPAVQHLST